MDLAQLPVSNSCAPLINTSFGFPVREDVAFATSDGQPNKGVRKIAEKFLTTLQQPLLRVLEPGETVFVVTKCMAPVGAVAQLTMSWLLMRAFSVVLVATDRRLIEFTVDSSDKWRGSVRAIRWTDLRKAKASNFLSGSLTLTPNAAKKVQYTRLPMRAAKALKVLLPRLMEQNIGRPATESSFVSLCPRCSQQLVMGTASCQHCGLEFRTASALRTRCLLPGGGYFCVNLKPMGVLMALVELLLYLEVLVLLVSNEPDRLEAAAFVLVVLAIEKLVMFHHANYFIKLFMPVSMKAITEQQASAAVAR